MNTYRPIPARPIVLMSPETGRDTWYYDITDGVAKMVGITDIEGGFVLQQYGGPGEGSAIIVDIEDEVRHSRMTRKVGGAGRIVHCYEVTTEADSNGVIFGRRGERRGRLICRADATMRADEVL